MLDKDPSKRPTAVEILQESLVQQRLEVQCALPAQLSNWSTIVDNNAPSLTTPQNLRGKIQMQKQLSSTKVAEEAQAIARAL